MTTQNNDYHIPVLLESVLDVLAPRSGERYLDLTLGYGGHARRILQLTDTTDTAVLVDRDDFALSTNADLKEQGARLVHSDYHAAAQRLAREHETFDVILMDLGVSSPQLDQPERGFSFQAEGPLDMRMDRSASLTAADIVNTYREADLARILSSYGEESLARSLSIAHAIVTHRPLTTTLELANLITDVFGGKRGKIHPATKTFQALRLATNDELTQLERTLPLIPRLLRKGGRVGIISFHSLEDRQVKRYFKEQSHSGFESELRELTKHPIEGSTHDVTNPRARSAKLRAAVKT